jgi:DNA-binding CsgD family transcriptional regulator
VPYVTSETRFERRALALVFERAKPPVSPVDRLRQRYGLTVAEAEVALRLAEGLSTEEIALQRKASRNTVRNQVQALLWKMEARSRGDVIRIVSRLLETGGG